MRIVYLNPAAQLGGAERCLLDMIAGVQETENSVEPHLVVSTEGPLIARAEKLGVRVTVLPMPDSLVGLGASTLNDSRRSRAVMDLGRRSAKASWATLRYRSVLAKTLSRLKPDLIHSNGIKFHLLAGLAAPRRVPLVWHIHDFISLRPFLTMALRITSIRARGAFAVSRAVQQDAQAIFPRFPVELIYNGIDTDEFSPGLVPGVRLDQLAGLPEARSETVRIGLVATYARWKGHEVFLKAAAQLLRVSQRPPVRFYLVGGPIYQTSGSQFSTDELRTIAAGLNIGADIGFIPFQHKPAEVYRALNIVVHASTQPEPFGRTIVEGMACAKPVIAAQSGGAAELFTHNYDAMGVPPNDPAALATAICGLTINPDRRRTLSNNARQTAVEQFSRHRLGPQIHALYRLFTRAACAA